MTEEERKLVATLRYCDPFKDNNAKCSECPTDGKYCIKKNGTIIQASADLIESLSAQLDQVTRERDAAESNKFQYGTGFLKGFEAAYPKWISVKDRLPMEGQLVLVYLGGYTGSLMELCSLDEFGGWVTDMRIAEDAPITHWMPLPEPPEVIENDA